MVNKAQLFQKQGDGIICIFGHPFLNNEINDNINRANNCTKEIIKATENTDFSSKVAFHCGIRNYYQTRFKNSLTIRLGGKLEWSHNERKVSDLKGINFKVFYSIKQNL